MTLQPPPPAHGPLCVSAGVQWPEVMEDGARHVPLSPGRLFSADQKPQDVLPTLYKAGGWALPGGPPRTGSPFWS